MQQHYSFDADYVRRLQAGDDATEEHFCRYFGDLIYLKAAARLRFGKDPAEDVRQETLLRVLRTVRKGAIEHPERLGGFVNAVCNNVILEVLRRGKRLNQFPEDAPDVPSGEVGVEIGILHDERRSLVREAIEQMAPQDRDLLRRIFLEEEDKDAVCKEFQVTRAYLRVLLHRARTRLRSALAR